MHAVVSLLDDAHDQRVHRLWELLDLETGVRRIIQRSPFPHFSYHVAAHYDIDRLTATLHEIAQRTPPFSIQTAGWGVFSGPTPAVYVSVVTTLPLLTLHRAIWRTVDRTAKGANAYYKPGRWVPHITLAQRDVTPDKLPFIIHHLSKHPVEWRIPITSLALILDNGEPHELALTIPLAG